MAKPKLALIERELTELRAQLPKSNSRYEHHSASSRIVELKKLVGTSFGDELHRHVVVSAIAALQSFHRSILADIIAYSDEYKIRAAEIIDEKITLRDAISISTNANITLGELISRAAPCNSLQGLLSTLTKVLGVDAKATLAAAVSKFERHESGPKTPLVKDIDALFAQLDEAFRLRHICAHEAAADLTISAEQAATAIDTVKLWMDAVDGAVWATVLIDIPLTTFEMNMVARDDLLEARKNLASELWFARRYARFMSDIGQFRRNYIAWKAAVFDWVKLAYWSQQGTMWRHVGASALADMYNEHAKRLRGWTLYYREGAIVEPTATEPNGNSAKAVAQPDQ